MRIGILTLPTLHLNYGCLLQAYALQTVLKRMGHQVMTDRYGSQEYLSLAERLMYFTYSCIRRYILRNKKYNPYRYCLTSLNKEKQTIRVTELDHFVDQYLTTTRFFNKGDRPSRKILGSLDAIVVGSDQVWRPIYTNLHATYFLDFLHSTNIKRLAYAASFGIDNLSEYDPRLLVKCKQLIKRFDAVSVREDSGIDLCKQMGVHATQLLDPTLLLEKEDYIQLIEQPDTTTPKNILTCYILDQSPAKTEFIKKTATKLNLKVVNISPYPLSSTSSLDEELIYPSVSSWLAGFRDAKFVITDSYHGTLFAIIFQKAFLTIINNDRGRARFESLSRCFPIQDRIIDENSCLTYEFSYKIDFEAIREIKNAKQKEALCFLSNNLN